MDWKKLNTLSKKELKELQNKKLHKFISEQLYPFSPYYKRLFDKHNIKPEKIKTVEDLRFIPFTSKQDFLPTKENPRTSRDFILQPNEELIKKYSPKSKLLKLAALKIVKGSNYVKKLIGDEYHPLFLTLTTGTTNQPISFFYTRHDLNNLYTSGYRLLEVFGQKEYGKGVNLFPYAPHLAFWQTVYSAISHGDFCLSTGGGKVMETDKNIEAISKIEPTIIIGEPSFVYHIIRSAKEKKRDFSFVKKVVLGANRVPLGFKQKIAGLLKSMGAPEVFIFGTYGFTESKCAWGECPTPIEISSGYHTYPDKEIFEVVDPESGEAKEEGEDGELVYTCIDARGSCVLRYRTGDLVRGGMTSEKCPYCGANVARISSDITRASNIKDLMLSKIKGTLVNLNDLDSILGAEKGVEEWQIEIKKKDNDPYEVDELIIFICISSDADAEAIKNNLSHKIKSATEVGVNEIVILPHREMIEKVELEKSFKAKRFVDARPKI